MEFSKILDAIVNFLIMIVACCFTYLFTLKAINKQSKAQKTMDAEKFIDESQSSSINQLFDKVNECREKSDCSERMASQKQNMDEKLAYTLETNTIRSNALYAKMEEKEIILGEIAEQLRFDQQKHSMFIETTSNDMKSLLDNFAKIHVGFIEEKENRAKEG